MSSARSLPSTSSGRQPNISSATGFQARIRPSSSIVTNASVELSTIVASRCPPGSRSPVPAGCRRPATQPTRSRSGSTRPPGHVLARADVDVVGDRPNRDAAQRSVAISSPGNIPSSSATRAIGMTWSPSSPFFSSEFSSRATSSPHVQRDAAIAITIVVRRRFRGITSGPKHVSHSIAPPIPLSSNSLPGPG